MQDYVNMDRCYIFFLFKNIAAHCLCVIFQFRNI